MHRMIKRFGMMSGLFAAIITMALSGVASAQCQRGICCSAGAAGPDHNFQTARALVGDTIDLRALTGNGDTAVCTDIGVTVTNVHFTIFHGDVTEVQPNLITAPHQFTLPGCDPSQGTSTTNVPSTTVADAADGVQGFLIVEEDASGIENVSAGVNLPTSTSCQTVVFVFTPCLKVTKLVACQPAGGDCSLATYCKSATGFIDDQPAAAFCYSVTVTNCGNDDITIQSVIDSSFGDKFDAFTNANSGAFFPAGASTTFFFSELETHGNTNTITVNGIEAIDGKSLQASDSATTTVFKASISCQKDISLNGQGGVFSNTVSVPAGTNPNVTYRVIVTNDGTAPLVNVQVTDAAVAGLDQTISSLAAGAHTNLFFTDTADHVAGCLANCANTLPNTVHVSAVVPNNPASCVCGIGTNGEPVMVTSTCSALLQCQCAPGIQIIKQVTCLTSDGCPPAGDPAYSKIATGVVNSVFCYSITVLNTGSVDLVNINVTDTTPGGPVDSLVSACFPTSFSLAAGTSTNCIHSTSYPGVTGDVPDFVHAVGQDTAGHTVSSSDNASVHIIPVPLNCQKLVSSNGVDFVKNLDLGAQSTPQSVIWKLTVSNPNTFPLQNVVISEVNALPNGTSCTTNGDAVTFPLTVPFLDAGASIDILCSNTVSCPGSTANSFQAQGEVSPTTGICAIGTNGLPVKSDICSSSASVTCTPPATPGCRTTGGGKQPSNNTCPVVKYVTHGGQVGAPFGAAGAPDCSLGLAGGYFNPCIRGEYQHVRHIKGGLRGTFHAASNGNEHDFDSLACACLPCDTFDLSTPVWGPFVTSSTPHPLTCHPQDRTYNGDGIIENGLCNPDRTPNCGPEPRKAPANKICFSGVGDYTLSNGKKTENKVVFRVDIEDRGEPGNAHAIGQSGKSNPPDRYRMRMWIIDPASVNTAPILALREAVACKNAHIEVVAGTLPCGQSINGNTSVPEPDIDDGGDLDRGNRQIHPNTGATCN
ncbi:MAG TPA: hypothetical protein VNL17_05590 [Verrucomicrobiae bacterium]|nr:hypothetical protein [Verrucomicrobiae bacterium]